MRIWALQTSGERVNQAVKISNVLGVLEEQQGDQWEWSQWARGRVEMILESSRAPGLHGVLQDSRFYSGEMRSNWKVSDFPMYFKQNSNFFPSLWPGLCPSFQLRHMPLPLAYSVTATWPLKSSYPLLQYNTYPTSSPFFSFLFSMMYLCCSTHL